MFGAGYPGLPTMTVDDWYEQRRRQGVVSGQSAPQRAPGRELQSENWSREFVKSLEEGEQGCVQGVKHPLTEEDLTLLGCENNWIDRLLFANSSFLSKPSPGRASVLRT